MAGIGYSSERGVFGSQPLGKERMSRVSVAETDGVVEVDVDVTVAETK